MKKQQKDKKFILNIINSIIRNIIIFTIYIINNTREI